VEHGTWTAAVDLYHNWWATETGCVCDTKSNARVIRI